MVRFVLGAATVALVAACGGGGGGNDSPTPPTPPPATPRLELVAGVSGGAGSADGAYANARLNGPVGIATDGSGTIYFTETYGNRVRRASGGTVAKFPASQTGTRGFVDGPEPRFYEPEAIAASVGGIAYVADTNNHAIRQIDPTGNTTTLAGTTAGGFADGTGAAAKFLYPRGIVRDLAGNLFVLDTGNAAIRRVTPAGVVTLFAGNPAVRATVDGFGVGASFFIPTAIAIDATGNLYVADNGTIRRVSPLGAVTTIAGVAHQLQVVDGGPGVARFGDIGGLAVTSDGVIYATENAHHVVRQLAVNGVVTTVAGTLDTQGAADGIGAAARFRNPAGIALDTPTGNLLIADTGNHTIRVLTRTGSVSTLIGALPPSGAIDGVGTVARFGAVTDLAIGVGSTIFVADPGNAVLRRFDTATGNVQTVGGVLGSRGTEDGPAGTGRLFSPVAVATGFRTDPYVADVQTFFCHTPILCESSSSAIRQVDQFGTIRTIAGSLSAAGDADGTGTAARFRSLSDIVLGDGGNLYVSDSSGTIRRITPAGVVTTLAGLARNRAATDGTGSEARFLNPGSMVLDRDGNLIVADGGSMLRKVSLAGVVTTIAGSATASDPVDGVGTNARFAALGRLAIDVDGNIYAADGSTIRKITPGLLVTTIAGTKGQDGFIAGPLPGVVTPRALAVPLSGDDRNLYIGIDSGIAVIRNRP